MKLSFVLATLSNVHSILSLHMMSIMKIAVLCLVVFLALCEVQAKCKCDCPTTSPVCGKDSKTGEKQTFPSPCALICYNCTFNKRFVMIKQGDC
ncbi:hypothetical protein GE061_010376 [Apolygus lucorum]|uniref:Kazal-like domain-containing protein n=1 Tax=Apolygus lucorum TaxID=248454 RepID=A0A8S9Y2W8_APOLU|nr:hypothetical protein GE061_010376 [Apolygus lucorum]